MIGDISKAIVAECFVKGFADCSSILAAATTKRAKVNNGDTETGICTRHFRRDAQVAR